MVGTVVHMAVVMEAVMEVVMAVIDYEDSVIQSLNTLRGSVSNTSRYRVRFLKFRMNFNRLSSRVDAH